MIKWLLPVFVFIQIIYNQLGYAQKVSDIKVNVLKDKTEIKYIANDVYPNNYYYIKLEVSTDGGKSFFEPLKVELSGDIRHQEEFNSGEKTIIWNKSANKNLIARITIEPFYKLNFKVTDISVRAKENKLYINYKIEGLDIRDEYFVILTVSEDDWVTEYEPNTVTGDVGILTNAADGVKEIIWDVFKDKPEGISEVDCNVRVLKHTSSSTKFFETIFGNRYEKSKLSNIGLSFIYSYNSFNSPQIESSNLLGGDLSLSFFPVILSGYYSVGKAVAPPPQTKGDSLLIKEWGIDLQLGILPLFSGVVFPSIGIGYKEFIIPYFGGTSNNLVIGSYYSIFSINIFLTEFLKISSSYILPFISDSNHEHTKVKFLIGYFW